MFVPPPMGTNIVSLILDNSINNNAAFVCNAFSFNGKKMWIIPLCCFQWPCVLDNLYHFTESGISFPEILLFSL